MCFIFMCFPFFAKRAVFRRPVNTPRGHAKIRRSRVIFGRQGREDARTRDAH